MGTTLNSRVQRYIKIFSKSFTTFVQRFLKIVGSALKKVVQGFIKFFSTFFFYYWKILETRGFFFIIPYFLIFVKKFSYARIPRGEIFESSKKWRKLVMKIMVTRYQTGREGLPKNSIGICGFPLTRFFRLALKMRFFISKFCKKKINQI